MKHVRTPASAAILPLAALMLMAAPAVRPGAASAFDGHWSVVIITEAGDCDRAYRYPVEVVNGDISYSGEAGIIFSGRVDARGKLSATVQRGSQSATGTGQLGRESGTGTWSGKSKTSQCRGRWEAERRNS